MEFYATLEVPRLITDLYTAKILVTGAAGFIGSHFVDELVRDGHRARHRI